MCVAIFLIEFLWNSFSNLMKNTKSKLLISKKKLLMKISSKWISFHSFVLVTQRYRKIPSFRKYWAFIAHLSHKGEKDRNLQWVKSYRHSNLKSILNPCDSAWNRYGQLLSSHQCSHCVSRHSEMSQQISQCLPF